MRRYSEDGLWLERVEGSLEGLPPLIDLEGKATIPSIKALVSAQNEQRLYYVGLSKSVIEHLGEIVHIERRALGALGPHDPFAITESTKAATELSLDFDVILYGYHQELAQESNEIFSEKLPWILIEALSQEQLEDATQGPSESPWERS